MYAEARKNAPKDTKAAHKLFDETVEKTRLATGWFMQSDGKWRNEFSDYDAKIKDDVLKRFSVDGDVMLNYLKSLNTLK